MKPVIVYFVTGDIIGDQIVAMEDKMEALYPNRTTNVVHVESESEKYEILSRYNVEEMNSFLAETLWQQVEEDD